MMVMNKLDKLVNFGYIYIYNHMYSKAMYLHAQVDEALRKHLPKPMDAFAYTSVFYLLLS